MHLFSTFIKFSFMLTMSTIEAKAQELPNCDNKVHGFSSMGQYYQIKFDDVENLNIDVFNILNNDIRRDSTISLSAKIKGRDIPTIKSSINHSQPGVFAVNNNQLVVLHSAFYTTIDLSDGEAVHLDYNSILKNNELAALHIHPASKVVGLEKIVKRAIPPCCDEKGQFLETSLKNRETAIKVDYADSLYYGVNDEGDVSFRLSARYGLYEFEALQDDVWVSLFDVPHVQSDFVPFKLSENFSIWMQYKNDNDDTLLYRYLGNEDDAIESTVIYPADEEAKPEFSKHNGEIVWVNTNYGVKEVGSHGVELEYIKKFFPAFESGDIAWAEIEYSNFDLSKFLLHYIDGYGDRKIYLNQLEHEPIPICATSRFE